MRLLPLLLFIPALAVAQTHTRGEFQFIVESPPPFVEPVDIPKKTALPAEGAMRVWLNDTQHDLRGVERLYRRYVSEALTAEGVSDVAQPRIDFDPSYQKLSVHAITVTRTGTSSSRLKPEAVTLARREQIADSMGIYTGLVTAMIELDDVRVGDIVDISYTLTGTHPVLGVLGGDDYWLASSANMVRRSVRILSADEQRWRTPTGIKAPAANKLDDHIEYRLQRDDIAAVALEPDLPGWAEPFPILQRTIAPDWQAVARWAAALYPAATSSAEFDTLVGQFASQVDAPARALAALRFVQDDIRYLSLSLGESTHRPAAPEVVLERRFGDCKDKSRLLVSLLGALDIAAQPVLVHSSAGYALPGKLPRAGAFDHVIVRIELPGGPVFVDPTATLQRGDFVSQGFPEFGHGLIVAESTTALAPLKRSGPSIDGYRSQYTHRVEGVDSTVDVSLTWRGAYAEWMRRRIASESKRSIADALRAPLVSIYGNAKGLQDIAVDDNAEDNSLTISDRVSISKFLQSQGRKERFTINADVIGELLPLTQATEPKGPLGVAYPTTIEQVFIVELPKDALPAAERLDVDIADEALKFERKVQLRDGRFTADFKATTQHHEVSGERVPAHAQLRRRIHDALGISVDVERHGAKASSREERMRKLLGEGK